MTPDSSAVWATSGSGVDLYLQRASAGYRHLGSLEGGSLPLRAQDRASLWSSIPRGSVSLNWLRARDRDLRPTRTVGVGLSQSFQRSSLHATALQAATFPTPSRWCPPAESVRCRSCTKIGLPEPPTTTVTCCCRTCAAE